MTMQTANQEIYASAPGDPMLTELRGPVLVLTLNRPDRLNAWNRAMEDRYFDLLEAADDDPHVRAVVVTGAGRGFCAGADMDNLRHVGKADARSLTRPRPRDTPMRLRKPLIGAINGPVAGLGLVEALYCDVRFGSPGARFTTAFSRRGLIAEYGLTVLLTRTVGRSRATDLLLSARMVDADEALRIGLLDHRASDTADGAALAAAVDYATDLAAHCSPRSMAVIKQQLRRDRDSDYASAVTRATELMLQAFHSPDASEGVASFLERRPPAFPPLPSRSESDSAADDGAPAGERKA